MTLQLLLIPALCCDDGLYAGLMPGLGALARPDFINPSQPTLAACAARVLAVAEPRFIVAGTSFGGHVAREVALAAPERVAGLWIMGAGAGAPAEPAQGAARSAALRAGRSHEVHEMFARDIAYLPGPRGAEAQARFRDMAARSDDEATARRNDALSARPDRWADLVRIAAPSLLLWGREDSFSPASQGLRMAGLIPRARFVEIPDCGHLPSLEAPEHTLEAAEHWLASLPD